MELMAKSGETLIFDEPYYSIAKQYNWRSNTVGGKKYYSAYANGKSQSLSKLVFDIKPNHIVYHSNGVSEDFSNDNIIICSRHDIWSITDKKPGQTSQYYYVSWFPHHNKWGVEQERNDEVRKRWLFEEEIEAALWADHRNAVVLKNDRKLNFPELSHEELKSKIDDINLKYGTTRQEKHSNTRQGRTFCKKKTTPYVGVSKQGNKYVAQICHMGKKEIICRVDDVLTAAKAYNERAIELRGEHARINEL